MMVQKDKCFRSIPSHFTIGHTPHVHCTFPIHTSCSLHLSERSHGDLAAYERARLALTSSTLLFEWHTVYVTSCLLPTDTTHSIQFNSKYKKHNKLQMVVTTKKCSCKPSCKIPLSLTVCILKFLSSFSFNQLSCFNMLPQ